MLLYFLKLVWEISKISHKKEQFTEFFECRVYRDFYSLEFFMTKVEKEIDFISSRVFMEGGSITLKEWTFFESSL